MESKLKGQAVRGTPLPLPSPMQEARAHTSWRMPLIHTARQATRKKAPSRAPSRAGPPPWRPPAPRWRPAAWRHALPAQRSSAPGACPQTQTCGGGEGRGRGSAATKLPAGARGSRQVGRLVAAWGAPAGAASQQERQLERRLPALTQASSPPPACARCGRTSRTGGCRGARARVRQIVAKGPRQAHRRQHTGGAAHIQYFRPARRAGRADAGAALPCGAPAPPAGRRLLPDHGSPLKCRPATLATHLVTSPDSLVSIWSPTRPTTTCAGGCVQWVGGWWGPV